MDNVGDITADNILMVSVEIPSCPVLFLFGNLDIMHITSHGNEKSLLVY